MYRTFFFYVATLLCGCAAVHINATHDATAPGLHFYRPDFYLLVSQVEDGKFESKIVTLPNKAEEYVITSTTGVFGTAEANATLENGWNLTVFGSRYSAPRPTARFRRPSQHLGV